MPRDRNKTSDAGLNSRINGLWVKGIPPNDAEVLTYVSAEGDIEWRPPAGVSSGVTSLNALTGALSITAGSGISVTPGGSNIQIAATGGSGTVTNTGTLTAHAVILGNGGVDVKALGSLGTAAQVLTSNGAGVDPSWQAASGGVTSVFTRTGAVTAQTGDYTVGQVTGAVASTRAINTNLPLTGGGDLSADRTLDINDFTGDSGAGGTDGAVPAPAAGDAAAGKFLKANGTWAVPSGTSGGTVTSVAMTGDNVIFNTSVTGSPVTTSGTLVPSLKTQTANTVLAGPTTGGAATPTFRALVAADLPAGTGTVTSVAESFIGGLISVAGSPITTSGTLALTVAGTSGGMVYFSSASTWASSGALAAGQFVLGGGAGAAPTTTFSVVPVANGGTSFSSYTKGDVIVASGSTTLTKLAVGTDGQVLTADSAQTNGTKWSSQPYDMKAMNVETNTAEYVVDVVGRAVALPGNFSGAVGIVLANPAATYAITVKKNGSSVGTISVSTGGVFTFATTAGAAVSLVAGDYISFVPPATVDSSLTGLGITLVGTR